MLHQEPVTAAEARILLHEVHTNGRHLPLFSSYITAEHMSKLLPFVQEPSFIIYHINYGYGEHALAPGPDHVLWLNRSPRNETTIYENPHVSTWYFLEIAPRQLSVYSIAVLLSLTIPVRPATSRLVQHVNDIPAIPNPLPPGHIPDYLIEGESERRYALSSRLHPPQGNGRIITFWVWQQQFGLIFRFRVLIEQRTQKIIIARHLVGEAVGNLTIPL